MLWQRQNIFPESILFQRGARQAIVGKFHSHTLPARAYAVQHSTQPCRASTVFYRVKTCCISVRKRRIGVETVGRLIRNKELCSTHGRSDGKLFHPRSTEIALQINPQHRFMAFGSWENYFIAECSQILLMCRPDRHLAPHHLHTPRRCSERARCGRVGEQGFLRMLRCPPGPAAPTAMIF